MSGIEKWMAFFKNDLSDREMEELAMQDAAIDSAWSAVDAYLADIAQRRAHDAIEKAERDYISFVKGAREEGFSAGVSQGIMKMALSCLKNGLSVKDVAKMAEMPIDDIHKLAKDNGITIRI